jgi:hypothetical protein
MRLKTGMNTTAAPSSVASPPEELPLCGELARTTPRPFLHEALTFVTFEPGLYEVVETFAATKG